MSFKHWSTADSLLLESQVRYIQKVRIAYDTVAERRDNRDTLTYRIIIKSPVRPLNILQCISMAWIIAGNLENVRNWDVVFYKRGEREARVNLEVRPIRQNKWISIRQIQFPILFIANYFLGTIICHKETSMMAIGFVSAYSIEMPTFNFMHLRFRFEITLVISNGAISRVPIFSLCTVPRTFIPECRVVGSVIHAITWPWP